MKRARQVTESKRKVFAYSQIMKVNIFHLHNVLIVIKESQTAVVKAENVYDSLD
jgi:hypothetical protein